MKRIREAWRSLVTRHGTAWAAVVVVGAVTVPGGTVAAPVLCWTLGVVKGDSR